MDNINYITYSSKVTYSFDEETKLFTFSLLERGGPVIFSEDFELGKKSFHEAMNIALAVRNLKFFDGTNKAKNPAFKRTNSNDSVLNDVQYLQLEIV